MSHYLDILAADQARRNARAMRSAQARWDNMAPPDEDDDELTESQALDIAHDELDLTPGAIVAWLSEACDDHGEPLDREELQRAVSDPRHQLQPHEALTVLFSLQPPYAARALGVLQREYRRAMQHKARRRADELLAEQEAERSRREEEAVAERAYWRNLEAAS